MNKIVTIIRESALARFLIPAGIMLIAAGIVFLVVTVQNRDYIRTESTVTKVETDEEAGVDEKGNPEDPTYKVTLKYTVDGTEYEAELGGVSKYDEGDKMTIYYDPSDPSQIKQTKSMLIPLAMIIAGIAALVGGILSAVNTVKKYNKMRNQEREWANG